MDFVGVLLGDDNTFGTQKYKERVRFGAVFQKTSPVNPDEWDIYNSVRDDDIDAHGVEGFRGVKFIRAIVSHF